MVEWWLWVFAVSFSLLAFPKPSLAFFIRLPTSFRPQLALSTSAVCHSVRRRQRFEWRMNSVTHTSAAPWGDLDNLVEAAQLYKDVYHDGRINEQYKVPSKSPWPEHLHGLSLGKRLKLLLASTDALGGLPPTALKDEVFSEKVELLKTSHLNMTVVSNWDVLYNGLLAYKEIYGDLRVLLKFVIPDEEPWPAYTHQFKLGREVMKAKQSGGNLFTDPSHMAALANLGFAWSAPNTPSTASGEPTADFLEENTNSSQGDFTQTRFDFLYKALEVYLKLNGNVVVPETFVVPSESRWPSQFWGANLGAQVRGIRNYGTLVANKPGRKESLRQLGFTFNTAKNVNLNPSNDKKKKKEEVASADASSWTERHSVDGVAKKLTATTSSSTTTTTTATSPSSTSTTSSTTTKKRGRKEEVDVDTDDFDDFESAFADGEEEGDDEEEEEEEEEDSLEDNDDYDYYREDEMVDDLMNNNTLMKEDVTKLRNYFGTINRGRKRKLTLSRVTILMQQRRALDELRRRDMLLYPENPEMTIDLGRVFEFDKVREERAGVILQSMNDRQNSPSRSVRRSAAFEGVQTPFELSQLLNPAIPETAILEMRRLGHRLIEFGRFKWESVVAALKTYKDYFGDVNVPADFRLSKDILKQYPSFNRSHHRMKLGGIVESIRIGDVDGYEDESRRKELEELGFNWGDLATYQRFRFPAMLLGLKVYYVAHENLFLRPDFVVPDNEPTWPTWMIGMPLGLWAAVARVQQQMLEKHYPERKVMLTEMRFMWWLPPGNIPKKYFEPLQ